MTDYDRRLIPNRYVGDLDEGVANHEDWRARTGLSLGYPGWGLLYYSLLTLLDPDRQNFVVETGTNVGSSAIIIAQAIVDSGRPTEFHTIELEEDIYEEAMRRFEQAGVAHVVTAHHGDSLELLPRLVERTEEVTLAFLDGDHLHDHVVREFDILVEKMRPDGAVIMDNTYRIASDGEDPRVNGALRTILQRHGGNVINLPFCSFYTPGIAIWQRQAFAAMEPPGRDSW